MATVNQFSYTKLLSANLAVTPNADAVVENEMSDGYTSKFNRFANDFITYDLTYLLSNAEYASFLSWWKANKSQFFNFVEPHSDATVDARISNSFTLTPYTVKQNYWTLSLQIERVI